MRPHLEYCAPVWSPCLRRDMDEMEKVQHRSTKLIRLSYEERLKHLHLPSVYACCLRGDLIEKFKALLTSMQFRKSTNDRTRGHNLKLYKKKFLTNIYKNFFLIELSTCGINYFNMSWKLIVLILLKTDLTIIGQY